MDQKLLDALNNIGLGLEELVDAINSKKEAKSSTATAIQSGNFSKDLKSISDGIKSIKTDTQQIIKNQQTIIAQGKARENDKIKDIEADPKKESAIRKGVGTIVLIAVAVLAIGMAFKLIGDVNVLSVIGLSLGITLVAIAFEKVAQLKLGLKEAAIASAVIVIASLGLMLSSHLLNLVQPVSATKMITTIAIAAGFAVLGPSISKLVSSFKGMSFIDLVKTVVFLPLILPAISLSIALSSHVLQYVKPFGLSQFISSILIAGVFVVLSYSMRNIIKSFKDIDPATALVASISAPLLLVALSYSIWKSSEFLAQVSPIGISQFLTSIGISIVFIGLAFAASQIIRRLKGISTADMAKAVISIPLLLVAMSGAIWLSSIILDKVTVVSTEKLINAGLIGAGLAIIAIAMAPTIKILANVGIGNMIKGAIIIPILAASIMVSSLILNLGTYEKYPGLQWIAGVSLSLLTFGLGALALGLAVFGPQALVFAAGLVAILGVAGTIVGVSHILKKGSYENPGMLDWAKSVSLLYLTFTPILLILGAAAMASAVVSLFGPNPWKMAQTAIEDVAKTIVSSSNILADGYVDKEGVKIRPNYKGGPTKKWAEGVSIALGAFSPVYGMLMRNKIFSLFGGGGVGPEDFTRAIKTVSQGIISAARFFASPENPQVWAGHPTRQWSEGVGLAIGAFAPVYEILAANSGWFKSGVSAEDFAGKFNDNGKLVKDGAIQIIARGIISAAKFFAMNTAPFDEGNYPSKQWGEGVGSALGAFSPVFDLLMEKSGFWRSGDSVIRSMISGIDGVSTAIVNVAKRFSILDPNVFETYPSLTWGQNVEKTIKLFTQISNYIDEQKAPYWKATSIANRMVRMAKILHGGSDFFSNTIDPNYIKNVSQNMLDFTELVKKLVEAEDGNILSRLGNNLLGNDPIVQIAKRMITLSEGYDKLADSLIKLGAAMRILNISDIRMLGGLTTTIASPKGTDIKQDDSKGIFSFKKGPDSPTVESIAESEKISLKEDMTKIIKLLTNIDKSTESLNDIAMSMDRTVDEGIKIKEVK